MSDSTHNTADPSEAIVLPPKHDESKPTIAEDPASSPPAIIPEPKDPDLLLPPSKTTAPNTTADGDNHAVLPQSQTIAADGDNDSEAETLISSPVKKREALKKGKHANTKDSTVKQEHQEPSEHDDASTDDFTAPKRAHAGADKLQRAESGDESDSLSEVLSDASSSDTSDKAVEEHMSDASGHDDSDHDIAEQDEGQLSNPRKRKHRESYTPANIEPPRRRRRAHDDHHLKPVDENGDSPSPKLRRHQRTISAQSSLADPNRSVSGGSAGLVPSATARQRRAATQFSTNDTKPTKNTWDSDTSSETSQRHQLTKNARNNMRSTSTPGRPMPRDHKRHVNKYGFTRLAEACENGDLEMVKEWRIKDPEQLEQREFAGNTPLQVASLNGYPEIVSYLLAEHCDPHSANTDKDTPLIDAVENGHLEVVKLLLNAGVNPLAENRKGQQALDVIDEDTDNFQEIRTALREAIEEWKRNDKGQHSLKDGNTGYRPGPSKELHFINYTSSNLLRMARENDQDGIVQMLKARVPVTNEIVAAAAKTGNTYTVSMLLTEMKPKDAKKRPELPLLAVIGTSHFEMVKYLTGADGFNPTWRSRSNGFTWYELAKHRQGANWEQEMKHFKELYDKHAKSTRLSSSPVSRRENGKRRRSPLKQLDSDVDMDDPDANEQARSKRRLVSKKVMREASRHAPAFSSDSEHDAEKDSVKVPATSKSSRPRKTEASSSQQPKPRSKRGSSSMRDLPTPVDSGQVHSPAPDVEAEEEQKIKLEEMERQRKEDEAAAAAAEADRIAELEARKAAEKLEEERRKAEQLRLEEEAAVAARVEAARQAEQDRIELERRQAEERRLEREERIKTFPSALQHVLSLSATAKTKYLSKHRFFPVQVVRRCDLDGSVDPSDENAEEADELWMLNYQAAALLDHDNAASLLGLPIEPATKSSAMSGVTTMQATPDHREKVSHILDSYMFTHHIHTFGDVKDLAAQMAIVGQATQLANEERERFVAMEPLHWIRFDDFFAAATAAGGADCPHLAGWDLKKYRFDCLPGVASCTAERGESDGQQQRNGDDGPKVNGVKETYSTTNGTSNGLPKQRAGSVRWGLAPFHVVRD